MMGNGQAREPVSRCAAPRENDVHRYSFAHMGKTIFKRFVALRQVSLIKTALGAKKFGQGRAWGHLKQSGKMGKLIP
jgi:hypothetical protein